MKHLLTACVLVLSLFALSAAADELSGVIADSKCKHLDGSERSVKCTENCVKKGGASPVFVNTADNAVYTITNPEKVEDHLGHKVKVTGKVEGDKITIDTVEKASTE